MKKLISAVMALTMLAGVSTTAFAIEDRSTDVTLSVEPSYAVTIPSTVKLTKQTDNSYKGDGTITTSAIRLVKGKAVTVSIQSDFEMETAQGAKQVYTATVDGKANALTNNAKFASFETNENPQSVKLNFAAANPKYAGEYTDVVTFDIAVETII